MRIFAHKNYKCGLFFPMGAGYAKPEINLPWPNHRDVSVGLTSVVIHMNYVENDLYLQEDNSVKKYRTAKRLSHLELLIQGF